MGLQSPVPSFAEVKWGVPIRCGLDVDIVWKHIPKVWSNASSPAEKKCWPSWSTWYFRPQSARVVSDLSRSFPCPQATATYAHRAVCTYRTSDLVMRLSSVVYPVQSHNTSFVLTEAILQTSQASFARVPKLAATGYCASAGAIAIQHQNPWQAYASQMRYILSSWTDLRNNLVNLVLKGGRKDYADGRDIEHCSGDSLMSGVIAQLSARFASGWICECAHVRACRI